MEWMQLFGQYFSIGLLLICAYDIIKAILGVQHHKNYFLYMFPEQRYHIFDEGYYRYAVFLTASQLFIALLFVIVFLVFFPKSWFFYPLLVIPLYVGASVRFKTEMLKRGIVVSKGKHDLDSYRSKL
ncbi:MAG: hypothetical protein ACRDBX_00130 [Erysipelotrichaceae bacterium]